MLVYSLYIAFGSIFSLLEIKLYLIVTRDIDFIMVLRVINYLFVRCTMLIN